MYLEKWYADTISNGHTQILYRANLHLGGATIGYSGILSPTCRSHVSVSLRGTALPTLFDDRICWPATANEPLLIWHNARSRARDLWQHDGRKITWNPLVLNGKSNTGEPHHRAGGGYVERLTMNFAPWHLGLDLLKWGRYCGPKHSLVWIEWCGQFPMRLALLDGVDESLESADRRVIRTRNAQLDIDNPVEITDEPLGTGALRPLSWIRMFAAQRVQRFLAGVETKWVAEATLTTQSGETERGTVIYEEVRWP